MAPVFQGGLRRGRTFLPAIAAGLLFFAIACGSGGETIKIGVSGNFHDINIDPMRHGARLAVKEINAQGGVRGRMLELVERDDWEDPDSAVAAAQSLYDAGVVAVIGHGFSGLTMAAAPVYNGGVDPVVHISPTASAPAVTASGPFTFRMCPTDLAHGSALARWARDGLGLRRGAVIYGNDDYGRGVRKAFAAEFSKVGGTITEMDPFIGNPPTVGPYLERIAVRGRSQFIVVAGYLEEGESILTEARGRGIMLPIMGGDGLERIERMGPIANGTFVSAAYMSLLDTPKNTEFVATWARTYPEMPPPNLAAAASYDAIYLLRDVIEEAGTERRAIRDAVAATGNSRPSFEGVIGTIAFGPNGDVTVPNIFVGVAQDGEVVLAGETQ